MKNITFQSILKPLTKQLIETGVSRFGVDYDCRKLKAWDHLIAMIYAQIYEIKSLRTLEVAFNSQTNLLRLTHTNKIRRSTLSDANQRRSPDFFFWLLEQVMSLLPEKFCTKINKIVRLLDSSPIQIKGLGDEWARSFRTLRCQGLKLHVEYDLGVSVPVKVKTSYPNYNDSTMGQSWPIVEEIVYVFDKGYYDFNWWWTIHQKKAYFVTRLKDNAAVIEEVCYPVTGDTILADSLFKFKNKFPRGGKKNLYTESLRRILVKRKGEKPLVLVTNLQNISAEIIADLYKARWDIELFFKWVKQNLKIKKYLGRSENAVKNQLAIALITFLLIKLFHFRVKNNLSLQHTLVWIRHNFYLDEKKFNVAGPPIYHFKSRFLVNMEGVYL